MATWVTHFMIADGVLQQLPGLDKRGFCVGNIAPDCNVENEDWTAFTPSREVTHWMQGARKKASDCDAFCEAYITGGRGDTASDEQYAFLLGYYAHLITDAAFQAMIRNEDRVKAVWSRIKADAALREAGAGMEETWDSVKKLISKQERMREIYAMEAQYLQEHPNSGYLTEILPLKEFPDYIDYLPRGSVVRKIGVMGYLPRPDESLTKFVTISPEEYAAFVDGTIQLVVEQFMQKHLIRHPQGHSKKYYAAYDERYKTAHARGVSWSSNISTPIVMEVIRKYNIGYEQRLLEVGCGEGRDSKAVLERGYRLLATDISKEAIAYCQKTMPQYERNFRILDCLSERLDARFDFVFAIAVIHMLVLDEDRNGFYRFVRDHLSEDGIALICTMGDGEFETQSDISQAYTLQERDHESGKMMVAGTSCRMVSFRTFEKELAQNGLDIVEKGITGSLPDFNSLMYAVVKRH